MITYKKIDRLTIGGAGFGNSYNFEVTRGALVTLAHGERDVAFNFKLAGLPVPAELEGPYDSYGRKV
jgi:hypothetical protein